VIEVDPKIEQAFAEVLARSRHRAADITDRVAATQRSIEERSKQIQEEGQRLSAELDRKVAEKKEGERNPWQNRPARSTVLEFGADDEQGRPAPPTQPIPVQHPVPPGGFVAPPPPPAPEPTAPAMQPVLSFDFEDEDAQPAAPVVEQAPPRRPPSRRRPADTDEDEDWSGRSWMR
jgi:exonuclease VII large subunit